MADSLPLCPECSSEHAYEMGALLVCPMCGHEWSARIRNGQPDERPSDVFRQELTHLERP